MRAMSLFAIEILDRVSSSDTTTPSMGAHSAAWTNTATAAMSHTTRARIKARWKPQRAT
jgi:hypothetical protein